MLSTQITEKPVSKFRIFAWVFSLAMLTITLSFWLLWFAQEQARRDSTLADVEQHIDVARQVLNNELGNLRFELQVLIENPLLTRYVRQPSQINLQQLQQYFLRFIKHRPINDQLRLLSGSGRELLRVNQPQGHPVIVANKTLQNKSTRDYFIAASSLKTGQVLLSRFDLNREHGKIERPLKPTFRLATPVFTESGLRKVILVMNIRGQKVLDRFRQAFGGEVAWFSLFNRQGFLLQQISNIPQQAVPVKLRTWGYVFDDKINFANLQPKIWKQIASTPSNELTVAKGTYISTTVYPWNVTHATASTWPSKVPAEQLFWKIVAFVPAVNVGSFFTAYGLGAYLKLYVLLLLLAILMCWLFTDARAKYLEGLNQIKKTALHDPLTGLPNRVLLYDRWKQAVAESRRSGKKIALLFIDLDEFKDVNDRFGHKTGDNLLQRVAARLQSCLRESDTVARIGGDEFVALLGNIDRYADAGRVAGNIVQSIARPYPLGSQQISIQSSVGIAVCPDHGNHFGAILHEADIAMYEAKAKGKNQYAFRTKEKITLATQSAALKTIA